MYLALITLPLITFCCICVFGRFIGPRGTIVLSVFSALSCSIISVLIFYEVALCAVPCSITLGPYFNSELFDASWGFLYDTLTSVMCLVVTLISCLVIVYSCSYMIEDPHFIRFMSYLKLFTVAMLILVTADNYIQLFVGWEGVGLASFLLISFWFTRLQASKAAIQAMLLNRVGDVGLALGIICLFFSYKTTNYHALFAATTDSNYSTDILIEQVLNAPGPSILGPFLLDLNLLELACILLFIGAMGKSGQFGLHVWLPNAMNAPTPVSALLHAATMVTAGVFLLARSSPLFEFAPNACACVTVIGALTTLFAGTIGLVQNDFKSIIAYSTCSQLGYMVTICGLSNYNVGIFHLFNHAFFKALLFLTAGAVIHALANEQDIRKYGGLQQILIFSYSCLLIGTLALVGTPFLAGFYSKDVILELAASRYSLSADFAYLLTCFSVLTTSYYSFRLVFFCFQGDLKSKVDFNKSELKYKSVSSHKAVQFFTRHGKYTNLHKQTVKHAHDADWVMGLVLAFLALGSIYVGWAFKPMFISLGSDFWNNSIYMHHANVTLVEAEFLPQTIKLIPLILTICGALVAYIFTSVWVARSYNLVLAYFRPLILFLSQRWFYDKLLNEGLAYPAYSTGFNFIQVFDKGLLELLPIFGLGLRASLQNLYTKLGSTQSGLIYHYATIMILSALIGLVLLSFSDLVLTIDYRIFAILMSGLIAF